jgi:hypothetical protein
MAAGHFDEGPHPEEARSAVSKDDELSASWFETRFALLTMRDKE